MLRVDAESKIKFIGKPSIFSFPATLVKTKDDYFKNVKYKWGKAFPNQNRNDMKRDYLVAEGPNQITNNGNEILLNMWFFRDTTGFTHMEAGTDGTAADATQVALVAPLTPRVVIIDIFRLNNVVYWEGLFGKTDATGTWAELAMWNALTGGIMGARFVPPSTFGKTTSNVALVSWGVTATV